MSDTQQKEQPQAPVDLVEAAVAEMAPEPPETEEKPAEVQPEAIEEKPQEPAEAKPPADEQKKPDAPSEPVGEIPTSWKAVIRKEKAMMDAATDLKRREAALNQAETSHSEQYKRQVETFDAEMRSDPLGTLSRRYGMTLNDLAERALNDNKPGAAEANRQTQETAVGDTAGIKTEVSELRGLVQEMRAQGLVDQYRAGVEALLTGEKYELLRGRSDTDAIMERAGQFARSGNGMDAGELLDRLQSEYREDLTSMVSHGAAIKALKDLGYTVTAPSNGSGGTSEALQGQKPTQTITNGLNETPPPRPPRDPLTMSEEETIADAVAAMTD